MARARLPARAVFNAEPGRVSGNVVTSRKGSMVVEFGARRGRTRRHQPRRGRSAIDAWRAQDLALHALMSISPRASPATWAWCRGGIVLPARWPTRPRWWTCAFTADTNPDDLLERVRAIVTKRSPCLSAPRAASPTRAAPCP